jgi:hypothetical protein
MRRPCDLQVVDAARRTSVRSVHTPQLYPYILWGSGFYRNRATGGEAVEGLRTLNIFQSIESSVVRHGPVNEMESRRWGLTDRGTPAGEREPQCAKWD